ncbi:MAG TPA: hypothetical protein VGL12_04600, partial [Roseiarcus sp.]
ITAAAFDAIAATLPLGSVGFERDLTDRARSGRPCVLPLGRLFHFFKTLLASSSSSFESAM